MNTQRITYVFVTVVMLSFCNLIAQPGFNGFSFGRNGNDVGKKKSVIKELKLSNAQIGEIRTMISEFNVSNKILQRKIQVLKEDLRIEMLSDKPDKKSIKRVIESIADTKNEISVKAIEKMDDIKQILTLTQIVKLNDIRKAERESIEKKRNESKGDMAIDSKQRSNMFKSFSFSTSMEGNDENGEFNPDDIFGYPERELWLDNGRSGVSLGDGNSFNFSYPNDNNFNFGFPNNEMLFDEEDTVEPPQKQFKRIPPPDAPSRKPKSDSVDLQKQMFELNERLKQLEEELKKRDK